MATKKSNSISIYPNPIVGNTIGLQLVGIAEGVATIKLFNNVGQIIHQQTIASNGSNGSITLELSKEIAAGTYQLQLTDAKGNIFKETMLKIK